ncbi:hypothetical protein [Glaciibacter sp. 2TAF33]|uniref:hypothetical protein n=1 Tax=Glaciibacter sp. 2TAF33 TaxID=3233015 RepID=UPI003F92F000
MPQPEPPIVGARSRRRRALLVAALAVTAVLVCFGTLLALRATAQAQYASASAGLASRQAGSATVAASARAAIDDAQRLLADSAGKVLTEEPRLTLATAIDDATARIRPTITALKTATDAAAHVPDDGLLSAGIPLREAAGRLAALRFPAAQDLAAVATDLAGPRQAVTDAVAAWTAEQDRILRERYTNHVHAAGWYPELDACLGSVDLTARYGGVPTIAEHWSCGGRDFPDDPGTLITLTGLRAGTYRVEGIVAMLNQDTATTADLPRGFDLLYQTCQNGQSSSMSMTALTKVG